MGRAKLKTHLPLLKYLAHGKPGIVRALMRDASPELVRILCECAHNTLKGNVSLNPSQKKKLHKFKKQLRTLADKRKSSKEKRRALQTGGFLPALLAATVPVVTSVLGNLSRPR